MNVCPVCEHPRSGGAECEVCGKRLDGAPGAGAAIAPVEGLEPTALPPVDAGDERLIGLEPTLHAAVAAIEEPTPGLEATRAAPVDVDAAPAPDVEHGSSGIPGDAPTALPAVVACRYCRTPSASGERICSRCGMRLPLPGAAAPEAAPAARVCTCGLTVRGSRCPGCGARMG